MQRRRVFTAIIAAITGSLHLKTACGASEVVQQDESEDLYVRMRLPEGGLGLVTAVNASLKIDRTPDGDYVTITPNRRVI